MLWQMARPSRCGARYWPRSRIAAARSRPSSWQRSWSACAAMPPPAPRKVGYTPCVLLSARPRLIQVFQLLITASLQAARARKVTLLAMPSPCCGTCGQTFQYMCLMDGNAGAGSTAATTTGATTDATAGVAAQSGLRWAVIIASGGHFAAAIFDLAPPPAGRQLPRGEPPLYDVKTHRTFHRYVVRLISRTNYPLL